MIPTASHQMRSILRTTDDSEDMEAVVLDEWGGELAVETVPEPDPGATDVVVDVEACGVTRTIENAIQGGLADDPGLTPLIPGHEFAGVVDGVGDEVDSVSVGDRVLAYFYLVCNRCDACRRGDTNQCYNFSGWYGVNCDGAYAEKATISANNVLPLPDDASFVDGAIATDGLATPLHVAERTDIDDTDVVLILGAAGRIGIHMAQLATRRGAHVIAADIDEDRLAHVDSVTDDRVVTVDASDDDFSQQARDASPLDIGPTVVVDTVGYLDTLSAAWDAMGMGGQLVTLTTHHGHAFAPELQEYVIKEASIVGSRHATKDQVVRAARMLADGRVKPVQTETIGLEDVADTHARIRSGDTHGMLILEP